ncbi:MAG: transcriptional regulator PpsR [Alphaproteobacteria bacterium]|nr:transcriptional regulator PpsR [Alphaproteobacteria bacterium]
MEGSAPPIADPGRGFVRSSLGVLTADIAESVVTAGGDLALVIDRDGVIRDLALGNSAIPRDDVLAWLDRPWSDTVTVESRHKVDEMLRDALAVGRTRWREVNQVTPSHNSMMMRFVAVDAGRDGEVIAIGRDDRATVDIQQRLVEAQQSLEREYARLRDAEFRYRLLFRTSTEAVIVVDAATRKIVEANPAAEALLGEGRKASPGGLFSRLFDAQSQETISGLLAATAPQADPTPVRLVGQDHEVLAQASLFRQDRQTQHLVRLIPPSASASEGDARLKGVLERMPDAFLITTASLEILTANTAFLDLVRLAHLDQVKGQPLTRFLGREGIDRNILISNLRDHGVVRNLGASLRNALDEIEDVEVSAVAAPDGKETCFGFTLRRVVRRAGGRPESSPELRRSVEQLTELVGRVKLKDLVRETTDLVERLCIEAALDLTKDNRASAAEVLGLSRQSLYSKMHRFGLVTPQNEGK